MFDHLLESSHWDDSNKWSNTGFGKVIVVIEIINARYQGHAGVSLICANQDPVCIDVSIGWSVVNF